MAFNANNQVTNIDGNSNLHIGYDADGNMTSDGTNQYAYDAENRLCAVQSPSGMTGYYYGADGNRLSKGTISSLSCDLTKNGFAPTSFYALGLDGEQLSESDGNFNFLHGNVFLDGKVLATYTGTALLQSSWHYSLNDWLGTRRVQANYSGASENLFQSLAYGDNLTTSNGAGATENQFTSKERDVESGNDDFGARYYSSNLGRFLSPDWSPVPVAIPFANLSNPQTLNLYSCVKNNPLSSVDKDGHADWLEQVKQWLTSSHQASASASVTADQATEKNGGLSATAKAGTAQAGASASYGTNTSVSAKASATVAGVTINEGSNSTTAVNGLNANAGANAGVGLGGKAGVGVSAGASANADVLTGSQTETFSLGSVTITGTATGNVGIGANASFSLGTGGISASAGVTPGFGGALSFGISWGGDTVSGGASVKGTIDQTTTKINTPQVTQN
jgi:RHS repeat-associated protein